MSSLKSALKYLGFLSVLAGTGIAQLTVVSSATYTSGVAPGAIAAVFGSNMAVQQSSATLDQSGNLPTTIDATSVSVNGKAARLFFVSPGQINLVIPDDTPTGSVSISVSNGGVVQSGTFQVQLSAAGLFTIVCFRGDRAAAQNAVTGQLEPFQATTPENPGSDKRTILSIYGTGLRFAGNVARNPSVDVTSQVTAQFTDSNGNTYAGNVLYAGKQPTLAGLDQVNVVVPATLNGAGTVNVTLNVAGQTTKSVSIVMSARASANVQSPNYTISSVVSSAGGNAGAIVSAQLRNPAGVVFDSNHNLYIADSDNHLVRKVSAGGVVTNFAGTGIAGSSGDGGLAVSALLRRPTALAVDKQGSLYIVDTDDNRIRKVTSAGIISTLAGNGTAGFSGDGAPAASASLKSPQGIAVNPWGTIIFADTGNNRVRRVTADGLISTIAGGGGGTPATAIYNAAYLTTLNGPTDVAVDSQGTVFIADAGNFLIRRVGIDGAIFTIGGTGTSGSTGTNCPALQASFGSAVRLAIDPAGKLMVSDTANQKLRLIDGACYIADAAGTGAAGFSGDNGAALQAQLNTPAGVTIDPSGDVYFADSANQRIRRLSANTGVTVVVTPPPANGSGQPVVIDVSTGGTPAPADTTLQITSSLPLPGLPTTVTIPAGQTTAVITATTPVVSAAVPVTITASGPGGTATGSVTVTPGNGTGGGSGGGTGGGTTTPLISVVLAPGTILSGTPTVGRVVVNTPAPAGGTTVQLNSSSPLATVASSVTIPAGQTSAEFAIGTVASLLPVNVNIGAAVGGVNASGVLSLGGSGGSGSGGSGSGGSGSGGSGSGATQVALGSVSVSPSTIAAGQSGTGTVTLAAAAPAGGAQVAITSSIPGVSVPASITIPAGQTTGTFSVQAPATGVAASGIVSATSANTVSTAISVGAGGGGGAVLPAIAGVAVNAAALTGGQTATGTVTLSAAAPAGGLTVQLASSNPAVTVPASVTVPAGQTSATFSVATNPVAANVAATVNATGGSGSGASTSVGVNAPCVSGLSASANITNLLTGAGLLGVNATLNGPAAPGGVSLDLKSGGASVGTIVVPAGQTTGSANLNLPNLLALKGTNLTVSSGSCGIASATIN